MSDNRLMRGAPPSNAAQVTLGNWRKPPFNRWAFKHVREIIPSVEIANEPAGVRPLPVDICDISRLEIKTNGETLGWQAFLERTDTDSLVILKNGRIVQEYYAPDMRPSTQHILMSVSKSVLGLLIGILAESGDLLLDDPVAKLIPEVQGTAYAGARLRDLLDMRVGVLFDEDYLASGGAIIEYRKAQGWDPLEPGDKLLDLRSFFSKLVETDGAHGERFHYVSPNTDLLGWAIERATGRRYADLVSQYLWTPMGAERDAYITVDRLGAPRCAGGVCATTRDLARLGLLIAEGGQYRDQQIIPPAWIEDIVTRGDRQAWNAGDFADYFPGMPIHYRSKWYVHEGPAPMIYGVGVFGQNLFVDPKNQIIISKFSSQDLPMDKNKILLTMAAVQSILRYFQAPR